MAIFFLLTITEYFVCSDLLLGLSSLLGKLSGKALTSSLSLSLSSLFSNGVSRFDEFGDRRPTGDEDPLRGDDEEGRPRLESALLQFLKGNSKRFLS